MSILQIVVECRDKVSGIISRSELKAAEEIFNSGNCQMLSSSEVRFEMLVYNESGNRSAEYTLEIEFDMDIIPIYGGKPCGWNRYSFAALLQVKHELNLLTIPEPLKHKKYTRSGMINRVLKERSDKAENAKYRIKWAGNIYGDHILTNEKGVKYKIFLRDFENETGYSDSMDSGLNKLGTTKHIMYAFKELRNNRDLYDSMSKICPFIEIFCDPLDDYKVTWFFPHEPEKDEKLLIARYFKGKKHLGENDLASFLNFLEEVRGYPGVVVRPEVRRKVEAVFEKMLLQKLEKDYTPDFSKINAVLFPYQKEGVLFTLFRKSSIIADEMGLGKTIQAITSAILKKDIFGFTRTLIVCPASLKDQWRKEIEKFTAEKAVIVSGMPGERAELYKSPDYFFFIINYETVLRDHLAINKAGFDFIILDEAQKAKNYETLTSSSLKRLNVKHKLAITGTPIENRLIDIFSIMSILDPEFLGPLWEFSYQHCLFDPDKKDKINGYFDLDKLNSKLGEVLIRREKSRVMSQLPNLRQITIPVIMSTLQAEYHASYVKGLSQILSKKFLTPYDMQRMQLMLANMRMVCDSTYLVDKETSDSPKLEELKDLLFGKLDIGNRDVKIIIFSEWVKVHQMIGKVLRDNNIGYVELNGKVPVKYRGELIKKFETNREYKIFLSTEAGGTGLNLQIADTLINFELPWNPAKKNQRTGRIDRLGQKSDVLTIYTFITRNSIEEQIASGLLIKQNLFDGVLGEKGSPANVDFSSKGRSQFINQLEQFVIRSEQKEEVEPVQEELEFSAQEALADRITAESSDDELPEIDTQAEEAGKEGADVLPANDSSVQVEAVMNSGMQFLAGLFKMATGKDMGIENQKVEIDKATGEVVFRFKIPGVG